MLYQTLWDDHRILFSMTIYVFPCFPWTGLAGLLVPSLVSWVSLWHMLVRDLWVTHLWQPWVCVGHVCILDGSDCCPGVGLWPNWLHGPFIPTSVVTGWWVALMDRLMTHGLDEDVKSLPDSDPCCVSGKGPFLLLLLMILSLTCVALKVCENRPTHYCVCFLMNSMWGHRNTPRGWQVRLPARRHWLVRGGAGTTAQLFSSYHSAATCWGQESWGHWIEAEKTQKAKTKKP